jgi:iron(II)-dependent oxidoreductase
MRQLLVALAAVALSGAALPALERADLSPQAQALVPAGNVVTAVLRDGDEVTGLLVRQTPLEVVLKVQKRPGISMTRTFARAGVKELVSQDMAPLLGRKLLERELNKRENLPEDVYTASIALFDEFIEKCPEAEMVDAVKERRAAFAEELARLKDGLEKVEGEWLTPVRAAVKKFGGYSKKIEELGKRPDFRSNERVRDAYEKLVVVRRDIARSLPELMRRHVPLLVAEESFDDAVGEIMAFLHFWVGQVIGSEGAAASVIKEMDFDYILRMEHEVMDAYRRKLAREAVRRPRVREKDMVYVPGGYFLMGDPEAGPGDDTFPYRIVFVSPFQIDKYEVSNAQYREFVEHEKRTGDADMEHPDAPPLKKHDAEGWKKSNLAGDRQPVVGVDWFDAYAYAKWAGKRLPTEAEWELAARGQDARPYPWGEEKPAACSVNCREGRTFLAAEMDRQNPPEPPRKRGFRFGCRRQPEDAPKPTVLPSETWEVDQWLPEKARAAVEAGDLVWNQTYPSPYGLYHMAGNAAEWVGDRYDPAYYGRAPLRDPGGPAEGREHAYRGGAYTDTQGALLTYARGTVTHPNVKTGCTRKREPFIGFRCVKPLAIAAEGKTE